MTLKPTTREGFHRLYIEEALPRFQRWNFDMAAHGPSLHDENAYYGVRRYDGLAQRDQIEDTYDASDDWRKRPREAILALIQTCVDAVFKVGHATAEGLRKKLVL